MYPKGTGVVTVGFGTVKKNDTWTCEALKGCPILKEEKVSPEITMPSRLYYALTDLAREFKTEWFAYMGGTLEGVKAELTTIHFPAQTATGAHCEPLETERAPEGTICAIHSHNTMRAFFSSTDDNHANWPVELVINSEGHIAGRMRVPLRCGEFEQVDAKVFLRGSKLAKFFRPQLEAALAAGKAAEPERPTLPATQPLLAGGRHLGGFSACPVCEKNHAPHCQLTCVKCGNLMHPVGVLCPKDDPTSSHSRGFANIGGKIVSYCTRCTQWHADGECEKKDEKDAVTKAAEDAWGTDFGD